MKHLQGLLKSKTFWFNAVTGTLGVIDALGPKVVPPEISATVVAVGNVLLRLITTQPVSEK